MANNKKSTNDKTTKSKSYKSVKKVVDAYAQNLDERIESFELDLSELDASNYIKTNDYQDIDAVLKNNYLYNKIRMLQGVLNYFVKDYNEVFEACCDINKAKNIYAIYDLIEEYQEYYWSKNHYLLNTYFYKFNNKMLFTIDEMMENAFVNNVLIHNELKLYKNSVIKDLAFNMYHVTTSFSYVEKDTKKLKVIFVVLCSVTDLEFANKILKVVDTVFSSSEFENLLKSSNDINEYKKYINDIYQQISDNLKIDEYFISTYDLDVKKPNTMGYIKNRSS